MNKNSKVVSLSAVSKTHRAPSVQLPKSLQRVKLQGCKQLAVMLRGLFENADDTLFEMADKAGSNSEQNIYFEAMRDLRMKRSAMESQFQKTVVSGFDQLCHQAESDVSLGAVSVEGLSLLQNDELEQTVAIEAMSTRVVNRDQGRVLAHLTTRIDSLVSKSVTLINNPFGPRLLSEAFAVASNELEIDIKVKLIVFKLFEKYVLNQIEKLYLDVNHTLAEEGVLPGLTQDSVQRSAPINRSGSGGVTGSVVGANKQHSPSSALESYTEHQMAQQVFGTLQGLLAGSGFTAPVTGATQNRASTVASQQYLMGLLSELQQHTKYGNQSQPDDGLNVRQALNGLMHTQHHHASLSSVDDDTINLVSMLFEFILDDRNLPESIKALLGRLQIPILKVAVIDKAFFSKGAHPARRLLNEMASAAMGCSDQDVKAKDRLYQKLEKVVFKILQEFEDDMTVFQACLDDFMGFVAREQRRCELMEQRVRDAEEGKAKTQKARDSVQVVLSDKMAGKRLPAVVVNLLQNAWSQVLLLILLKEGVESEKWQNALVTVDSLIWSVSPINTAADRKKLLQMVPGLLKELRAGLMEISFDSFSMNQLFAELETIHLSNFKSKQANQDVSSDLIMVEPKNDSVDQQPLFQEVATPTESSVNTVQNPAPSGKPIAEISGPEALFQQQTATVESQVEGAEAGAVEPELSEDDPSYRLVDNLKIGAWVEFTESTEKSFRCKLAAAIKATGKYIFVNRTGVKVAERTRQNLALELRSGSMRLLDDAMLFDRALESVIGNLREMNQSRR